MDDKEVHDMFHRFDQKYFWGKLSSVRLNWSKNMTLCAGKTYCKERRGSTQCAIYLSQPLLTQRPPEDTVNTLLHEMIHAYLFVTEGGSHKMGHGPAFREHMTRINKLHGSKITVFHNFRKEVDKFRVHVYRCDGPCTKKRPYFGVLRRAISRPPGPTDRWWARHSQECGGTFHKVEGPDIKPDPVNKTHDSLKASSVQYPNTFTPKHSPSPKRTFSQKNKLSSNAIPSQELTPSPKPTQSGNMAARTPGDNNRKTMSGARKRLNYDNEEDGDNTTFKEEQLVQKIRQRHAHTSRSVLLSKEEARMIQRGRSPERGTLVEGRVNYSYRCRSSGKLNVRKYLERYRAYKEALAGAPQNAPVLQSPLDHPATQKSSRHEFSESGPSWRTKVTKLPQSSSWERTQSDSRTGGSSSQVTEAPCVTCWNCGVNVMVPEHASQIKEDSHKPSKVSVEEKKELKNSVSSQLVGCPSCGEMVPKEKLNDHLDECLMPFTDDF